MRRITFSGEKRDERSATRQSEASYLTDGLASPNLVKQRSSNRLSRKRTRKFLEEEPELFEPDTELGEEPKSTCFHCAKLIDMFQNRYKTITFVSNKVENRLTTLKENPNNNWASTDVDYLVSLYLKANDRHIANYTSDFRDFEQKIHETKGKKQLKKKWGNLANVDLKRPTTACLEREKHNKLMRNIVEFDKAETQVYKLNREGKTNELS